MIESAFRGLSERQRELGVLINRARTQRGLAQFGAGELLVQITDSEPVLKEVPSWALAECFRLAMAGHDAAHPFGVFEVVTVWREMSDTARERLFDETAVQSLPPGPPCGWCDGKGLMRVKADGKPVKWVSTADTAGVKRCWCRVGGIEPEDCDVEVGLELVREIDFKSAVRGLLNRMPGGG